MLPVILNILVSVFIKLVGKGSVENGPVELLPVVLKPPVAPDAPVVPVEPIKDIVLIILVEKTGPVGPVVP